MAELDSELLERVARWCAEAGRQAGVGEIRAALEPLGWDELLAVRALLADPPPARPLGPQALADLARGAPADVAAERERAGRYRSEDAGDTAATAATPDAGAPKVARRAKGARRPAPAAVVVRRARDRAPSPPEAAPARPLLDELQLPGGRSVLERLIRRHGGRRAVIAAAVAAGWRRADGAEVGEDEVAALLELHGLARPFQRRERDELLHALRAAGGVRSRAAERVGLDVARLEAALRRVGAERVAEEIRAERRAELRARATLTERVRLLLEDPERLRDLGLLEEVEADLRRRLPEHVRALRAGSAPVRAAFAASLSLEAGAAAALAERFGLALGAAGPRERPPARGGVGGGRGAARPGAGRPPRAGPPGRAPFARTGPARPDRRAEGRGASAGRPRPAAEPPRGGAPGGGSRPAFSRPERRSIPGGQPRPAGPGGAPGGRPRSFSGPGAGPGGRPRSFSGPGAGPGGRPRPFSGPGAGPGGRPRPFSGPGAGPGGRGGPRPPGRPGKAPGAPGARSGPPRPGGRRPPHAGGRPAPRGRGPRRP